MPSSVTHKQLKQISVSGGDIIDKARSASKVFSLARAGGCI